MALTDTEIDDIAGPADYFDRRVFARAIESAAVAPLLERIAALTAQVEQAAQPVAWVDERAIQWLADRASRAGASITTRLTQLKSFERPMPLYTAPPKAVPLTDEQIDEMWKAPMSADWEHREFARAIEAHHGITLATVEKGASDAN